MKYDISKIKSTVLETYPDLKNFEEFSGDDKKLRFVIVLLDEDNQEGDIERRVASAAKKAGLKPDGLLEDKEVEKMLCRMFVLLNNDTFELWLSKKIALGEANFQLRTSVSNYDDPIKATKIKQEVGKGAEQMRTDILKLERILFRDKAIEGKIKESVQNRTIHYSELYSESDTVE